jgi:type IV pilus assembly protein PilN
MSYRINLLPHRELRRERQKKGFLLVSGATAALAVIAAVAVGFVISLQIDRQAERNEIIRQANARLDQQIRQIASLRADIESLRARQSAVETLQTDRTVPVHLLDELVRFTPEGTFLKSVSQKARDVTMVGVAQSNERVSDLLRNLSRESTWLEKPHLVEIRAIPLGGAQQQVAAKSRDGQIVRRVYEFTVKVAVKGGEPAVAPVPGPGTRPVRPVARHSQAGGG